MSTETNPHAKLVDAIKAHGLQNPVNSELRGEILRRRSVGGQSLGGAAAMLVLAAMTRAKGDDRVVVGESIPPAPKKQPSPPHVVPRGKLPKRLFRNRPAAAAEG